MYLVIRAHALGAVVSRTLQTVQQEGVLGGLDLEAADGTSGVRRNASLRHREEQIASIDHLAQQFGIKALLDTEKVGRAHRLRDHIKRGVLLVAKIGVKDSSFDIHVR